MTYSSKEQSQDATDGNSSNLKLAWNSIWIKLIEVSVYTIDQLGLHCFYRAFTSLNARYKGGILNAPILVYTFD